MSQEALAKLVGTSQAQIDRLEKGQRKLTKEWAVRIAPHLGIDPSDLLFPDRARHLESEEVAAQIGKPGDRPMTIGQETGRRGIPDDASAQLDVTAGMGGGGLTVISDGVPGRSGMTFAAEHVRDFWRLPGDVLASLGLKARDVIVVPVQGDSMADTLMEGDFVFVDTRHRLPSPDGVYCLTDDFGGVVIKRLEVASHPRDEEIVVRIISDNPKHPPKDRALSEIQIIGRVLRRFGVVG
ncbi:LexA family transcriptional regulator [Xanthobacter dioxanivorans]|nr:LexA family transcriptional regulator [Xanthobacter dioxanivorans]